MSIKPAKVQFNGGELSPWLEGRTDIAKYDKTAKLCRNFIPLAEGSLKRRGGTRFVAATPEGDSILFKIVPDPEEAEVYINGVKRREVYLARGDEVSYRVSCEGYVTVVDTLTADADEELAVRLVAKGIMCELTVETVPADAVVELNGYERRSLRINKNGEVFYRVAKENYITQEGTIIADMTKTVTIELVKEKNTTTATGATSSGWQPVRRSGAATGRNGAFTLNSATVFCRLCLPGKIWLRRGIWTKACLNIPTVRN